MNVIVPRPITRDSMASNICDPIVTPSAFGYCVPDTDNLLLQDLFDTTCSLHGARVAVALLGDNSESSQRRVLTYDELRDRSLRMARYLCLNGIKRGDRVLICLPRDLDQYMAILGTLYAGAVYVPVDWALPQERIDFIAEDCGAAIVLTASERLAEMVVPALALDLVLGDLAALDPAPVTDPALSSADPAYIIYTSGTTGRPKGIVISHGNACHHVQSEGEILALDPSDIVFGSFSVAFDMSVETMWSAFFIGAKLLVATEALAKAGPDIARLLAEHHVTVWHVVPSLMALVEQDLPSLRLLNVGGESCSADLVQRWARPKLRIINTYGPTETSVTATWAELQPGQRVTIGRPLPGYTAWIVNDMLMPLPAGAEGELLIGGPGVGLGYLNRASLTAEKFVFTPFIGPSGCSERVYRSGDLVRLNPGGEIEFIGRIDTQVKIRGFRVELGEIEAVLSEQTGVAQAIVQLFDDGQGTELLAAFLVPRAGAAIDLGAIQSVVCDLLPNYMRPTAYELLAALPTLPALARLTAGRCDGLPSQ